MHRLVIRGFADVLKTPVSRATRFFVPTTFHLPTT